MRHITNREGKVMANVGYLRVSTTDQRTDRQLEGVALDMVFEEKASAADTAKPQ